MGIGMKQDPLARFLKAVQRRVWLEKVLSRLRVAVWAGSGVLFALAAVSAVSTSIPVRWAFGASLLAAVLVALPVMLRRPSIVESAVRADYVFDGQSLLTTALEAQLGKLSKTPSCVVVLARAKEAVAAWWPRVNSVWQAPSPAAFALATVPAFIALLLLAVSSQSLVSGPAAQSQASIGAENVDDADDGVVDLRDSILRNAGVESEQGNNAEQVTLERDQLLSTDMSPVSGATAELIDKVASASPGFSAATDGVGTEAGDARRTPDLSSSPTVSEPSLLAGRSEEQIQRHGEATAGMRAGKSDYDETLFAGRRAREQILPAAAPPTASPWTTMTAAEVAYARRYLDDEKSRRE